MEAVTMNEGFETGSFDEHGLPIPKSYDGPKFDAREYWSGKYADADTLDEAISMRGQEAFAKSVKPDDFSSDGSPEERTKIGIAELWADSTWSEGNTQRDLDLELSVGNVREGDMLEIRRTLSDESERGYSFFSSDGHRLPYEPFHDYDDQFLSRALGECDPGETLACLVREVTCYGGDNDVPEDPTFCWRVYSCKVTVYRRTWTPELN